MKKVKKPTASLAKLWQEYFYKDAGKFIGPTHLQTADWHTEFTDAKGEVWKILGSLEGRDMPCEKLSTGEVFLWDRWQVSLLKHPERHLTATRKSEFFFPEKTKKRASKKIQEDTPSVTPQLNLFDEHVEDTEAKDATETPQDTETAGI